MPRFLLVVFQHKVVASPVSDPNIVTIVVLYYKIAPHSGAYSQFSTYNNMHSIYMTTTVSYFKNGPQIGNKRNRDRDNDYRDGTVSTMKRYTRRRRGGDRRNKNKRTEYSRRRRR